MVHTIRLKLVASFLAGVIIAIPIGCVLCREYQPITRNTNPDVQSILTATRQAAIEIIQSQGEQP